jgi:hypothetical protein
MILLKLKFQDETILAFNNTEEFDISRFLNKCHNLKVFTVEFKDSPIRRTPTISCSSLTTCLNNLVHVQFGLVVQNSAISTVLINCPNLRHLHANSCPDLTDADMSVCISRTNHTSLECFYIYEAPQLTVNAFQILLEGFPNLIHFGNLTRWAVNCEGITQVLRTMRENNLELEILCGSHWFSSTCAEIAHAL